MTDIEKLKALAPCPFCGSSDVEVLFHEHRGQMVMCRQCTAEGGLQESDVAAAEVWNMRANQVEPESVPVPTTVNMARMMLALGHRYLKDNVPEHLKVIQQNAEQNQAGARSGDEQYSANLNYDRAQLQALGQHQEKP